MVVELFKMENEVKFTRNIGFIAGTLGQGGAERQLFYYLKSILGYGGGAVVLSITQGEYWEDPIKQLGVKIIWVGKYKNRLLRLLNIIISSKKLNISIIQSQHFHTNLYATLTGKILGLRAIGASRSDLEREVKSLGFFGRISVLSPPLVAFNSLLSINKARSMGINSERIFYLPNFIDSQYFIPRGRRFDSSELRIIFVGRIGPPKKVERVIEIAERIRSLKINARISIYGDGIDFEKVIDLAKRKNLLNNNVIFFGRNNNIRDAYQSADVLLLTSDYEGTPNVVLEAMSCGLAIVASNVGDIPEIVHNGINGYTFEPDELDRAVTGLVELANNPKLLTKISENNRDFMVKSRDLLLLEGYLNKLYESTC